MVDEKYNGHSEEGWLTPSDALNRPFTRPLEDTSHHGQHDHTIMRRLGFKVGNIGLLIKENIVSELSENRAQICRIPNTASWLAGLINLRGNLIPVFDINALADIERKAKNKAMLLILGTGETAGALMIDDLPLHIRLAPEDKLDMLPSLPDSIRPYATTAYERDSQIWFNFDHVGFFQSLSSRVAR